MAIMAFMEGLNTFSQAFDANKTKLRKGAHWLTLTQIEVTITTMTCIIAVLLKRVEPRENENRVLLHTNDKVV